MSDGVIIGSVCTEKYVFCKNPHVHAAQCILTKHFVVNIDH